MQLADRRTKLIRFFLRYLNIGLAWIRSLPLQPVQFRLVPFEFLLDGFATLLRADEVVNTACQQQQRDEATHRQKEISFDPEHGSIYWLRFIGLASFTVT